MCEDHFARILADFKDFPKDLLVLAGEVKFQEFPGVRSLFQEFFRTPGIGIPRVCRNSVGPVADFANKMKATYSLQRRRRRMKASCLLNCSFPPDKTLGFYLINLKSRSRSI